jgi:hypothetical protein
MFTNIPEADHYPEAGRRLVVARHLAEDHQTVAFHAEGH